MIRIISGNNKSTVMIMCADEQGELKVVARNSQGSAVSYSTVVFKRELIANPAFVSALKEC